MALFSILQGSQTRLETWPLRLSFIKAQREIGSLQACPRYPDDRFNG
ncbi:uncharacterized protein CPUR_01174 [Claviceps purpurea 20.1]|uniref:Uncharacterized protein n=1 Tax=Claviceps purpurea (strain 20.1) TaxID=1111077 RepID=M1W2K4_CLAP2|nr:uncharacterized protein CPUR_01174 [Claviceps purpurea 20.1]